MAIPSPISTFPSLRAAIGYVPQDVFLFSDTIASNIAFGVDDAEPRDIEQAAQDAYVHDNIVAFPKGYETLLGERGVNLSGGQKQRISIARAILRKPRILIFDDCLSAVDTETEAIILGNLQRIMKGRTSIIVSHRVSTVRDADLILVLDEGRGLGTRFTCRLDCSRRVVYRTPPQAGKPQFLPRLRKPVSSRCRATRA